MSIAIDWDRDTWLFVPDAFPWHVYPDEDAWIDAVVGAFRRFGMRRRDREVLAEYLRGIRANNRFGAHRFLRYDAGILGGTTLDVFVQDHDPDASLDDLVGSEAHDTDVSDPIVTPVVTDGLGPGVRVERALRVPTHTEEVIGDSPEETLHYNFWVFRTDTSDVIVSVTDREPLKEGSLLTDIEAFVASVTLVEDST